MQQSRQMYLDSLRGIAAAIVVSVHYIAAFYPYAIFGRQELYRQTSPLEDLFHYPPFGIATAGHFAISVFFILSGYVLSYRFLGEPGHAGRLIAALVKRPVRLGGVVWFSVLAASVLWALDLYSNHAVARHLGYNRWFDSFWSGAFDPEILVYNLVFFPFASGKLYNTPLWTIVLELYGSLMIFLFLLVFGSWRWRLAVAIALAAYCHDSLYQGFWIGLIVADLVKHHPSFSALLSRSGAQVTLAALFLLLSSYPHNVVMDFLDTTIYSYLPQPAVAIGGGYPMLAALALFALVVTGPAVQRLLVHRPFLFLGRISYSLYVIHFLILGTLASSIFVAAGSTLGHHGAFLVAAVTGIAITLPLSIATTRFVDEPTIRIANRLGGAVRSALTAAGTRLARAPLDKV